MRTIALEEHFATATFWAGAGQALARQARSLDRGRIVDGLDEGG